MKNFPAFEKFGICNQIQRGAVSICSNMAGDSLRTSEKEQ
jgi:four helix bundle protein